MDMNEIVILTNGVDCTSVTINGKKLEKLTGFDFHAEIGSVKCTYKANAFVSGKPNFVQES